MKRIILLNGPPYSGKDTVANTLVGIDGMAMRRLSQPIKDACAVLFDLTVAEIVDLEKRENKDKKDPRFFGRSWRQVQIDMATFMRENYGDSIFADLCVSRIHTSPSRYFVIPDCRFQIEPDTFTRHFGTHNVLLLQLTRPGTDWSLDNGSYVCHRGRVIGLMNDQLPQTLQDTARIVVEEWLERG